MCYSYIIGEAGKVRLGKMPCKNAGGGTRQKPDAEPIGEGDEATGFIMRIRWLSVERYVGGFNSRNPHKGLGHRPLLPCAGHPKSASAFARSARAILKQNARPLSIRAGRLFSGRIGGKRAMYRRFERGGEPAPGERRLSPLP